MAQFDGSGNLPESPVAGLPSVDSLVQALVDIGDDPARADERAGLETAVVQAAHAEAAQSLAEIQRYLALISIHGGGLPYSVRQGMDLLLRYFSRPTR